MRKMTHLKLSGSMKCMLPTVPLLQADMEDATGPASTLQITVGIVESCKGHAPEAAVFPLSSSEGAWLASRLFLRWSTTKMAAPASRPARDITTERVW